MFQFLFLLSLFILVFLAAEMEYFLAPSAIFLILGAVSLIFGIMIFIYGNFRKQAAVAGQPEKGSVPPPDGKQLQRSSACLPAVVGGMYALIGIGIWALQLLGYLYSK
jgi:hypothetical protein